MSNRAERRAAERHARKSQPKPSAAPIFNDDLDVEPEDLETLAFMESIEPGYAAQQADSNELISILRRPPGEFKAAMQARWERKKAAGQPPVAFQASPQPPLAHQFTDVSEDQPAIAPPQPQSTTSAVQIAANRENSKLSCGPSSIAGKAIVTENRRTHGLTGRFTVLPWENAEDFESIAQSICAEHNPQTDTEQRLVDSLIQHYWLKQRAVQLQEKLLANSEDPTEVDPKKLGLFLRYQTTHERSYYKAERELQNLKKAKRNDDIGFESQDRQQEAHEARVRLTHAKAMNLEIDTACRQVMEVPIPNRERISFEELTRACTTAIASVIYNKQCNAAA